MLAWARSRELSENEVNGHDHHGVAITHADLVFGASSGFGQIRVVDLCAYDTTGALPLAGSWQARCDQTSGVFH